MDQWQKEMFQKLTEAPGPAGFEHDVRKLMRTYLEPYSDELIQDNLGSIFGIKRGDTEGPRIMVAGHMDEVGFMVTKVTEDGFLQFETLGGWWEQVMLSQRVEVITRDGKRLPGVIASIPPHVLTPERKKKPMSMEDMYIDIGMESREEAEEQGVIPGQPIAPVCPFTVMGNEKRIMAKAWDNRYGCGISVDLLKSLQGEEHPNVLYSGATVQEEVGLRGAKTAANMIDPDLFFAVDASAAGDIPGVKDGVGKLGEGTLLRILDRTMIAHRGLRDFVLDTAETHNIPYQFFISKGGTDAGSVHVTGAGVPSGVIGIPARYIHSNVSVMDIEDYAAAKELLVNLVKSLDRSTVEEIKKS